jgi:hypothetical protein
MSVRDHGLEAIRKSTVSITDAEYQIRTIATSGLLAGVSYDYFSVAYPTTTQEVYTYKTGGAGGTTVATVTINYTDATKNYITNATVV